MAYVLFSRFVYKNDTIYSEGDPASTFFIIVNGLITSERNFEIAYFHRVPVSLKSWSLKRI